MMQFHLSILIYVLLGELKGGAATDERELYRGLFNLSAGYNTHVRPRLNASEPVDVYIQMEISQLKNLDEKHQTLSVVGFFNAVWNDEFLSWNPAEYGGIKKINLPPTDVWLPDFGLENSAESFYDKNFKTDFWVQLFHTGKISWSFGGTFHTLCKLDNTYYPFDLQHCPIELENWSYTSDEVDLHHAMSEVHLENYHIHGIWHMSATRTTKVYLSYISQPGQQFPELVFELDLKRKSTFYILNMLIPCGLIVIIALAVYWVPPASGEKVSFGVTVLLAFTVFHLVIADETPVNSDFRPKLTLIVLSIMCLSSFSVVMSIFVMHLHEKSTAARVPRWLRGLAFRGVATILCMRASMPETDGGDGQVFPLEVKTRTDEDKGKEKEGGQMSEISSSLRYITHTMKEKERDNAILEEWRALGKVIDRVLFWVSFIVITVISWIILSETDQHHK